MFSKTPWAKDSKEHGDHKNQEESLTTILSSGEDRASLLLLIANCIDSMRAVLTSTFDPNEVDATFKEASKDSQELITRLREDPDEDETLDVPDMPDVGIGGTNNNSVEEITEEQKAKIKEQLKQRREEKARKALEARTQELTLEKMVALKSAALEHFDDWRDRVFERIGESLNAHDDESSKSGTHSQKQAHSDENPPALPPRKPTVPEAADTSLHTLYPPQETPLMQLSQAKRVLILHSLLLILLSLQHYSAHSRVLLIHLTSSFHLPLHILATDETKVARGLLEAASAAMNADEETKQKQADSKFGRKWKVGLGAVAGAALIGITGGLAAPLLAAGVGTVMGGLGLGATAAAGYLGALAGSAPLIGVLFGAYGGKMTGEMVNSYAKEVSDFAFIPAHKPAISITQNDKDQHRLRVAIGISGWLTEEPDVVKPWVVLSHGMEAFALRYELEAMMRLGNSMSTYVKSAAWSVARTELIKRTVFGALSAGLWPLGLARVARVVDNPFSVARSRSDKAGNVLADALINKCQGERPVTLIGYSLGARVIYACLNTLAERKAFGLVESVVLVGAATPSDSLGWRKMRSVVSGRVVNVFSTNDYLLGFLYRTSSLQYGIAGLQPVADVKGIENVDVSSLVDGHLKYRYLTGAILSKLGFEDIDTAEVEKEERRLRAEEEKAKQEQDIKAQEGEKDGDEEAAAMEEEVEKKNKAGMIGWMSDKMSAMKVATTGAVKGNSEDQKKDSQMRTGTEKEAEARV